MLDQDGDGLIKGPDLFKCQENVERDCKLGREIHELNEHYVNTHLRIVGKPKESNAISLDFYISFMSKLYGKNGQSCLIDEIMKKSMASECKFAKMSVFLPTELEIAESKRRKSKYLGITSGAIVSALGLFEAPD